MSATPLLVFADDWGRHPSSCQHLVRHLLPEHPTVWVNTIGTRTPRLDLETLRRATGKLRQWFGRSASAKSEPPPLGLTVCNPRMWPWLTRRIDRRLNRTLLMRQLRPIVESMPQVPVAVTTLPIVADLMGKLSVARWVYYCVDDFGEWPGLDRATMNRLEKVVVAKADVVLSVSENLRDRLQQMGRDSHLLTHGVDVDFWRSTNSPIGGIDQLERPLVVFWGVIDRRMDTAFVERLAHSMTRGTIVLAGPEQDPDPALAQLPRIRRIGPLPFTDLPNLAREAGVLMMPYVDQPVTRAMQPLKLNEYLATGKPVVVRDLPANREWADSLDLTSTPEAFAAAVLRRLESGLPPEQMKCRERLAGESWQAKAERFASIIFDS
jgi:glycosyltransferase involved in cell wall biosynthesis